MLARRFLVTVFLLALLGGAKTTLAEPKPSPVGEKVEDFTLSDVYGKTHSLADYADQKLVVLAFLGAECPRADSMPRDWNNCPTSTKIQASLY